MQNEITIEITVIKEMETTNPHLSDFLHAANSLFDKELNTFSPNSNIYKNNLQLAHI